METGNLAAAGSNQGLMQSRSGEYIQQDMQRQKLAQDTNEESLKPIDDYLKNKQQKSKDEETEIAKFIDFKNPVMPKDEEERVSEASSIVKMIKDKAPRQEIDKAKINFIANDERRKAEYERAVSDLKLANSKPDEYEVVSNPFEITSKADYKSKFGSDRYSTEHFIKPNSNIDITSWAIKKTPDFLKQTPQGLNKSKTEVGTSFADEDTRMKWQTSTINQMLDGVTPQSRALLKETTTEVLDNDPELQYYPEELDHVVKQVAAGKILKIWDSQKAETKIDNNAPIGGGGITINNLGGGKFQTKTGFYQVEQDQTDNDTREQQYRNFEDRNIENIKQNWVKSFTKYPKGATEEEKKKIDEDAYTKAENYANSEKGKAAVKELFDKNYPQGKKVTRIYPALIPKSDGSNPEINVVDSKGNTIAFTPEFYNIDEETHKPISVYGVEVVKEKDGDVTRNIQKPVVIPYNYKNKNINNVAPELAQVYKQQTGKDLDLSTNENKATPKKETVKEELYIYNGKAYPKSKLEQQGWDVTKLKKAE